MFTSKYIDSAINGTSYIFGSAARNIYFKASTSSKQTKMIILLELFVFCSNNTSTLLVIFVLNDITANIVSNFIFRNHYNKGETTKKYLLIIVLFLQIMLARWL